MTASQIRPDWAMVGWRENGHVCILASRHLTESQVDWQQREYVFRDFDDMRRNLKLAATAVVNMDDYIIVKAPTYIEAIAKLVRKWDPDLQANIEAADAVIDAEVIDENEKAIES